MNDEEIFDQVVAAFAASESALRNVANRRLRELGNYPELIRAVSSKFADMDADRQEGVIHALAPHLAEHKELRRLYVSAARERERPLVRRAALQELAAVSDDNDVRRLFIDALAEEPLAPLAVTGLSSQVRHSEVVEALSPLLRAPDPALRAAALEALTNPAVFRERAEEAATVSAELLVIPDQAVRIEALGLLEDAIRAVHDLLDRMDPQAAGFNVIERDVLPRLRAMERLLSQMPSTAQEALGARGQFIDNGARALGAAGALTSILANSDEAVTNTVTLISRLAPLVDHVVRFLSR